MSVLAIDVDWAHMDWAVVASTLLLAIVTAGLVYFTKRLADEAAATRAEMRLARAEDETARLQGVRPRLALGVDNLGAGIGFVTITNIGSGAALDVLAELDLGSDLGVRPVAFHLVAVGEKHQFMPIPDGGEFRRMDEFTASTETVTLRGSMRDVLGHTVAIDEAINVAQAWEITKVSRRRLPPDYEKTVTDELEKIRKALDDIKGTARNAYYRAWPPQDN